MTRAPNQTRVERLLARLTALAAGTAPSADDPAVAELIAGKLAAAGADGRILPTAAGRRALRRAALARQATVNPFRGQHGGLDTRIVDTPTGKARVPVDDAESPLGWLARRKSKSGRPMIEPHQVMAGERLREEFTRAQMMPRMTANWSGEASGSRRPGGGNLADTVIAARQRVRRALVATGPDLADVLLDVCCFLKGLEDIERQYKWPPRSAKVVLQLALDRLANHYGLASQARGRARARLRIWLAQDASFSVDGQ